MTIEFTDKGKYSRAWWINVLKRFGDKGAISVILAYAGTSKDMKTEEATQYFDQLANEGYLQAMERPNPMNKNRPIKRYIITSFGHRYLNEHSDELGVSRPSKAPVAVQEVPAPTQHIPRISEEKRGGARDITPHIAPSPGDQAAQGPSGMSGDVKEGSMDTVKPAKITRPIVTPQTVERAKETSDRDAAKKLLRNELNNILYEKFADQITAKELIERL